MEIDLVYLWCDGSTPDFIARKQAALKKANREFSINAIHEGRYVQVDELKYSLRSVEKYMPWIHHIFIVTNKQVPAWLNTDNPKVSVVEQADILPPDIGDVFNSNAIEACLYKIPGLSEHFLYACDDMFVNRRIKPSFFFRGEKKIVIRVNHDSINPKKCLYNVQLIYAHDKIAEKFGKRWHIKPHHNIDAYLKSDYKACAECFKEDFERTARHVFREGNSIQRFIVHLYSLVQGHAVLKSVDIKWYHKKLRWTKLFPIVSVYLDNYKLFWGLSMKLFRFKPKLFCINDGEFSVPEDRICAGKFLESHFRNKSSFEK